MNLPPGFDRERVRVALEQWRDNLSAAGLTFESSPELDRLLVSIFGNSPYLTQCLLRDPVFAIKALSLHPDQALNDVFSEMENETPHLAPTNDLKRILRVAKIRIALSTAIADITGLWSLEQVTSALSRLAETALTLACAHLLRMRAIAGDLELPGLASAGDRPFTAQDIARDSGLIVLAMGKLGARELNYSSDIDLIALYDPEVVRYVGNREPQDCFNRIIRDMAEIMQGRTADGYVFRVDLRLRPDAGATPVALSTDAAEIYYQSVGLNWERSAMIKARPVAGDLAAGRGFLDRISPFVWRKHLDYAALEDIHAIKRQIHSHHRHGDIAVADHDIKLGLGGIREIEFFAQTQQLIAGGRDPSLRAPETLAALKALTKSGWVDRQTEAALCESYCYLRRLEHRLQMIHDEQTQKLPATDEGVAHVAAFMGYPDRAAFEKELLAHLHRVQRHYGALFEDSAKPAKGAQLPFPGGNERADELAALAELEFDDPAKVAEVVRSWQLGRYRACRAERARRLLKDITPALLHALSATAEPDAALMRFNEFLGRLPSGVQLFSLFHANPWLLETVAEIMGSAPSLAEALSRNVLLLDAVLGPDFFSRLPGRDVLRQHLQTALNQARDFEDVLDITRRWANERKFQIGVQVLRNIMDGREASRAQTDIAEVVIEALLPEVQGEFAKRHGVLADAGLAVVAMGKLGGRELTPTSDLDLVLIYQGDGEETYSDGAKPLPRSQYFARLSQRLISALTARMGDGRLYEVDMRLRPSGRAGPIAVALNGFAEYQRQKAWTWEHMALTRARVIAGTPALAAAIEQEIRSVLTLTRDPDKLTRDVFDMRQKLDGEFKTGDPWDIKNVRGGLQDLEFISQFLQLRHAAECPEILDPNTCEVFKRLASAGVIPESEANDFWQAADLLQNVQGFLRLCFGDRFDESAAPVGLKKALAKAACRESFDALSPHIREVEARIYGRFKALIEEPATRSREQDMP
ncbi:MAG: bifunctional [glutamine synthetase] adenylyltransferase/[glutamine synthetase]-adenylyl-L-tyrosine phosphorylase [Sphingomonadales bacterium]